jgi:hypothetical protein
MKYIYIGFKNDEQIYGCYHPIVSKRVDEKVRTTMETAFDSSSKEEIQQLFSLIEWVSATEEDADNGTFLLDLIKRKDVNTYADRLQKTLAFLEMDEVEEKKIDLSQIQQSADYTHYIKKEDGKKKAIIRQKSLDRNKEGLLAVYLWDIDFCTLDVQEYGLKNNK